MIWHHEAVLGQWTYKDIIFADIGRIVLPGSNLINPRNDEIEAPHDPRFKIAQTMEAFARSVADVSNTLNTLNEVWLIGPAFP